MNYITKDDFFDFSGVDLELEFKNGNYDIDDPYKVFLKRVETATISILENRYDNPNIYEKIEKNINKFKEGMLWQIDYVLKNSELYMNNEDLNSTNPKKYICPLSYDIFRTIGLCNLPSY